MKANDEKQARKRLFRHCKPNFRTAQPEDMRWFWAAYRLGPNVDEAVTQEAFEDSVYEELSGFTSVQIVEDTNGRFESGFGPVGMFVANSDGWNLEPHVEFFPWATARNKVKSVVGFLTKERFSGHCGCIRIRVDEKHKELFRRLKAYVPIRTLGKIPCGRPDGPEHVFYVRGKM